MQVFKVFKVVVGFLAVFVALMVVSRAEAHAVPESANPPIDGVATEAPPRVEVVFSEEIVPDGTMLEVFTLEGTQVDLGDSEADLDDPERRRVVVELDPEVAPGRYIVQWTSLSAIDDDSVSGSFGFVFDPSATSTETLTAETAAGSPAPTSAAVEAPPAQHDDDNGFSTGLLVAAATVLVVAAFAMVMWRGRATTPPDLERTEQ